MKDKQKNILKLIEASKNGDTEEVKKWLPISDPKICNSEALRIASRYGYIEVVKLLIPVSDPKANDNESLRWACDYNNQELFDVLYPVSEPEKALKWMKKENKIHQIWNTDLLEERLKSEHEKKKIQTVIQKMPQKSMSKQKKI